MSVAVDIPDDVASILTLEEGGIERAVVEAVVWQEFQQGNISAGRAAELLGSSRDAFETERRQRGISLPFTLEELDQDLDWAKGRDSTK